MKSAYLYCRVSTDEQKSKGNSLEEQEDRLIKHREINGNMGVNPEINNWFNRK